MKNLGIDIMMGAVSIVCVISLVGLFVIGDVIEQWKEMRVQE